MSDKQTTALVLLVILAILFYLYNVKRLGNVVAAANGSAVVTTPIGTNVSSNLTGNSETLTASTNLGTNPESNSGLAGTLATGASLGTVLAGILEIG